MKEDFKQFLPLIMPYFLKDAARDIDLKIQDSEDVTAEKPDADQGYTTMNIQVKGMEGKK